MRRLTSALVLGFDSIESENHMKNHFRSETYIPIGVWVSHKFSLQSIIKSKNKLHKNCPKVLIILFSIHLNLR